MAVQAPFRLSIGRQNFRSGDMSSSANLGRAARAGFREIVKNFSRWVDHMNEQTAQVIHDALEPTLELSWEYCPVDTGELLGSSYLEIGGFRGQPQVEMGYAKGGHPSYAIFVHEVPMAHEPPTTYKFLQKAIDEDSDAIQARIIAGLKAVSGT